MQRRYPYQPYFLRICPQKPSDFRWLFFFADEFSTSAYTDKRTALPWGILQKVVRNMSLIVQKFGGSSVKDRERLMAVAQRIAAVRQNGNQVVVVVSAQGKTTDHLIEKAAEMMECPPKREMDVLLSAGEQMSVSLLAMALETLACPAVSLCGWQVAIHTNSTHQNARITKVDTEKIKDLLEQGLVVIVAGFQGVDEKGDITTLGRGGSDTTAVALASALKADRCQIFTDVEGVYTADPRLVESAQKLSEITYNDMLVMASMGAKVLHDRSVEMAKEQQVCLEVLSSFSENEGTLVRGIRDGLPSMRGITADRTVIRWYLPHVTLEDASRLMVELYRHEIRPDLTEQPAEQQLIFTVSGHSEKAVEAALQKFNLCAKRDDNWAKISVVGCGMHSFPNIKGQFLQALEQSEIPTRGCWLGERRYSVLVPREKATKATEALHNLVLRYHR